MMEERYSQSVEGADDGEAREDSVSPYGGETAWPGVWNPERRELPALRLWPARVLACDFGQVAETSCLTFPCI